MAWPLGKPNPGAGRKPGSLNRRQAALAERVAELGLPDPVVRLLYIGERAEREGDLELAADAYAKAAPYLSPRLAALDVKSEMRALAQEPRLIDDEALKLGLIDLWRQWQQRPLIDVRRQ